jgi:hypothetical protein
MMITYSSICTTLTACDMTGSSVDIDHTGRYAVYAAPGGDYKAHRIA